MKLFRLLSLMLFGALGTGCSQSKAQYTWVELPVENMDIVIVDQFKNLQLFLNDAQHRPYRNFKSLNKNLGPCKTIQFAMNAGMYHANYQPVGLYIEHGQNYAPLNDDNGAGNFFMQPNGVLAWNEQQAIIKTTADYASTNFVAHYATQSGPMLVINGQINPQFLIHSTSLKIRNGVGIKNNKIYFMISRTPVSFYEFARVFKEDLGIDQALYLDGSISSIYLPAQNLDIQRANLGPIVALLADEQCHTELD